MHDEVYTPDPLTSGERDLLQDLLSRFRNACRQWNASSEAVDLRKFLPAKGPLRTPALCELIKADLEVQWQHGRNTLLETYLEQFPELGSTRALPATVICEEYRVRHCYGDKPPLAAYQARFPEQFPEVERLVQAALASAGANATLKASFLAEPPHLTPKDGDAASLGTHTAPALPPMNQTSVGRSDQCEVLPLGGGYKLIARIGRGSFGDVWRAEAPGGVEVAIKVIFGSVTQDEAGQRELQALELMKRLRHTYLLPIHAFWQLEDRLIIAMELADGSLRDVVKKRAKEGKPGIPLADLVRYFREAAEAIDYLHANRVLHRDIKPENILLVGGHAQVADFGLARVLEQSRGLTATRGGGTPAYMAPEIIGQGKVGEQSDQYSLAASFAELRLNRPIFASTSFYELMQDHLTRTPDLSPLDKPEQQVLQRALAKDPRQRYGSCIEFMETFEQAVAQKPPEPPRPSLTRRLLVTSLLLSPLLGVIGFLTWYLAPDRLHLVPEALALKAGEAKLVTLEFKGKPQTEPIQLDFPRRPDGIAITDVSGQRETDGPIDASTSTLTVPGDCTSRDLRVLAAPDATGNPSQVRIQAASVGTATLRLTIEPRDYFLPESWRRAAEAKLVCHDGKVYYDQIDVGPEDLPVRFILIPNDKKDKTRRGAPETFYIMRDKVSVELFRRFADANPDRVKNSRWREIPSNKKNGRYPVMGVTADDAHQFARWLGGYLPLSVQWDQAAGRYRKDRGEGPFRMSSDNVGNLHIAVRRQEPEEVGQASDDISLYGVRDMSGNGYELTRSLALDERTVPLTNPSPKDFIKLRGYNFSANRPLLFADLEGEIDYQAHLYTDASDDTGFRVVLEP